MSTYEERKKVFASLKKKAQEEVKVNSILSEVDKIQDPHEYAMEIFNKLLQARDFDE